jgi:hypothetical protein
MAMRPAVVPGVYRNSNSFRRRYRNWSSRNWSSLGLRRCRIHQFFVGCSERADGGRERQIGRRELLEHGSVVCRCECKVVECRLQPSDRRPRRREHAVSPTEWSPPPEAKICRWRLRCARRKAVFHANQVQLGVGRPSQSLTSRGKCCAARTDAEAIMTSSTSVMGMPALFALFCASSSMMMYWGMPSACT